MIHLRARNCPLKCHHYISGVLKSYIDDQISPPSPIETQPIFSIYIKITSKKSKSVPYPFQPLAPLGSPGERPGQQGANVFRQ